MKKNIGSRSGFILGITFLIVSLIWFFWSKNTAIGIIWSVAGILELMIGLIQRSKEKRKTGSGQR